MSFHCQVTSSALLGLQQKEEKHWHDNNQTSKPTSEPVPSGKFGIKMEISFFCWHLQADTLLGKNNRRKQGQRTAKIKVPAWHEPTPRPVPLKDSCWISKAGFLPAQRATWWYRADITMLKARIIYNDARLFFLFSPSTSPENNTNRLKIHKREK